MLSETPGWFAWNVKLAPSVVKPEKRGFTQPWQALAAQEMNLFKWLFPLFFLMIAATAQAQPQPPSGPLYDPQGRLIPYDPPSEANEPPRPASKPKTAGKQKSASKPAASSKGKSRKPAAKSSGQGAKKGKPAAKPTSAKKKTK